MLFFWILVIAAIVGLIALYIINKSSPVDEAGRVNRFNSIVEFTAWTCGVAVVVAGFFFVVSYLTGYTNIVDYNAQIVESHEKQAVYEQRAKVVGDNPQSYLTQQYPTYEAGVIREIVDADPQLILLKFPELRTADTFLEYTRQYQGLKDAVYSQQTKRAELEADIARITNNNLIYPFQ